MKIKILLFSLILLFVVDGLHAQNFEWAKSIGGVGFDEGNSIALDASGNIYSIGRFQGTVDFDPGAGTSNLTSAGSYDIYILKLDASGDLIWAKSFGSSNYDVGNSITVDASGYIYATGEFELSVDFDPSPETSNITSHGGGDVFILKLDDSGNFIWAKSFGSIANNSGKSISVDAFGNVYTSGDFGGTVDFDPGAAVFNQSSPEGSGIFIQKLDASGNFLWAKTINNTDYNFGYSLALDSFGNVYTTGAFRGEIDFDPGASTYNITSNGDNDIFVQKLDASGNFVWVKTFGGTLNDIGWSITVDAQGDVYTTGYFGGTVDFNPDLSESFNITSAGSVDCFIQKLDASGAFLWAKSYGGTLADIPSSITLDNDGNIYSIGRFQGTAYFDPSSGIDSLISIGERDVYIQKLDSHGNYVWAISFGGTATEGGVSIKTDASGNIYSTGYFYGTADFDPDLLVNHTYTSNGERDIYIQKISRTTFGFNKHNFGSLFKAFPNSTSNNLIINLAENLTDITVVLRNVLGQEITRKTYPSVNQIDLVIEEPQGIYFIEISNNHQKALMKIVKQ
jgi:hypothetical protein